MRVRVHVSGTSPGVQVLGAGPPQWELQDEDNPATGGIVLAFVEIPPEYGARRRGCHCFVVACEGMGEGGPSIGGMRPSDRRCVDDAVVCAVAMTRISDAVLCAVAMTRISDAVVCAVAVTRIGARGTRSRAISSREASSTTSTAT